MKRAISPGCKSGACETEGRIPSSSTPRIGMRGDKRSAWRCAIQRKTTDSTRGDYSGLGGGAATRREGLKPLVSGPEIPLWHGL